MIMIIIMILMIITVIIIVVVVIINNNYNNNTTTTTYNNFTFPVGRLGVHRELPVGMYTACNMPPCASVHGDTTLFGFDWVRAFVVPAC